MVTTQHVLHLARMANRAGASSVEVQEFRECVERLVAWQAQAMTTLRLAEEFIVNGEALGFIEIPRPDDHDPATDTLPAIRTTMKLVPR